MHPARGSLLIIFLIQCRGGAPPAGRRDSVCFSSLNRSRARYVAGFVKAQSRPGVAGPRLHRRCRTSERNGFCSCFGLFCGHPDFQINTSSRAGDVKSYRAQGTAPSRPPRSSRRQISTAGGGSAFTRWYGLHDSPPIFTVRSSGCSPRRGSGRHGGG